MKRPEPGRPWDRWLWGVVLESAGERILLGESWAGRYPGDSEPTRALLFQTREQARDWCRQKMEAWQGTGAAHWKVRPVRVRETVVVDTP